MRALITRSGLFLVLVPYAGAQSFNLDFGDPASAHGVPSASYAGAGDAGQWQGISAQVTNGLIDINGSVTGASLTASALPMLDECGDAATQGADEALYDDRWFFDPPWVSLTLSGLEPGLYRVHMHLMMGPCIMMFSPLTVDIAGAVPASFDVKGYGWNGAPEERTSYSTQLVAIGAGQDLVIWTSSSPGFLSYTQHCGLQLVRMEEYEDTCFGDGSGAPCPCGNGGGPGEGCLASTGFGGRFATSGSTSVSVDDLRFTGHHLPVGQGALLFVGDTAIQGGAGTPFGDGVWCAGGNIVRLGVRMTNPNGQAYWGPGLASLGGWAPGDTRLFQGWFRDPSGPCGSGFNMTHAVRATFVP